MTLLKLFFWSLLLLFSELALIRWLSCEIRIFAYFSNLVLIVTFIGFGIGLVKRKININLFVCSLIILFFYASIELPYSYSKYGPIGMSKSLSVIKSFQTWARLDAITVMETLKLLAHGLFWFSSSILMIIIIFIPYGQKIGALFDDSKNSVLKSYGFNLAGSLAGILFFFILSFFNAPPEIWIGIIFFSFLIIDDSSIKIKSGIVIVLIIILTSYCINRSPDVNWSSYQKIEKSQNRISVNNTGYMIMLEQDVPSITRWNLPYKLGLNGKKVLIIGAGAGNDAAAAILNGAEDITAVEIDREIIKLGKKHHPELPYQNKKVKIIIDDARHYLQTSKEKFDLIIFSHLDSHTLLSGFTNVRLDNYIYTKESFKTALKALNNNGSVYISFFANIPWLTKKFHNTLSETVKNSDYHLTEAIAYYPDKRGMNSSQFFISSKIVSDSIKEKLSEKIYMDNLLLEKMRGEYFADITVDDWPYIYLQIKNIPGLIMLLSGILFLVSLFFLWNNLKKAGNIKGWLFYFAMGGGFLLLEVHNVSKMSLLFGTVWTVNAFVISAIMILIVAANYIIIKIKNINILILFFLLFVSFAVSYFVEMNFLIGYGIIFKLALSTIIYLSPIFFAGCIFSKNFKISGNNAAFFLGINSLGSVLGGLLENSSFKIGIRNTLIIAVCFYLVALIDYLRNKSKN